MKGDMIKELTAVMNRNGVDTTLNMPDFIIAEMLYAFLCTMESAQLKTKYWKEPKDKPIDL